MEIEQNEEEVKKDAHKVLEYMKEGKADVLDLSSYLKVAAWRQENKREAGWYI